MLGVSIQFTVLVAIVAAALFVLRPLAPRVRYVVWLLVLARLAIPVAVTSPWGTVPSSLAQLWVVEAPPGDRLVAGERLETSAPPEGAATAGAAGTTMRPGAGATVSPAGMLFLAWGIGVLGLVTVQVVRSARRRARMGAAIEPLPPEVDRRIDQLRTELGLRRAVDARVVRDDAIGGPLIQGWLRPRVLLPSSLVQSWRREALDAVLLHELIHLRRLDPAARALGNLLQIAYFFHPLAWWVGRRLAEEREKACDDAVVRRLRGEKRIYMKSLLRLVEERAVAAWGAPGLRMAAARRPLARRLKRMLQPHYDPQSERRDLRSGCARPQRRPRLRAFHGGTRAPIRSGRGTPADLHEGGPARRVLCGVRRTSRGGRPSQGGRRLHDRAQVGRGEAGCGDAGGPQPGAVRAPRGARASDGDVPGRSGRGRAPCPLRGRRRRGTRQTLSGGAQHGSFRPDDSLRSGTCDSRGGRRITTSTRSCRGSRCTRGARRSWGTRWPRFLHGAGDFPDTPRSWKRARRPCWTWATRS